DLTRRPDSPWLGGRSSGPVPGLVAAATGAFVAGLQPAGVAACAKHFPGHGDTSVDSHLDLPVVGGGEAALEIALRPFRAAVAAGVRSVMTAHLVVPSLDDAPATLSPAGLTGLLGERLGVCRLGLPGGAGVGREPRP